MSPCPVCMPLLWVTHRLHVVCSVNGHGPVYMPSLWVTHRLHVVCSVNGHGPVYMPLLWVTHRLHVVCSVNGHGPVCMPLLWVTRRVMWSLCECSLCVNGPLPCMYAFTPGHTQVTWSVV